MGDPKRARKKHIRPVKIWQKDRIEEDKVLMKEYGLKRKKEIWRMDYILTSLRKQAKNLTARDDEQSKKEEKQLLERLKRLSLMKAGKLDDVLNLTLKDILDRRLETIVYKKGLARSINQARQFIVYGHISIKGAKVTIPSYLVNGEEENNISYSPESSLANAEHAERIKEKKVEKTKEEKIKKEEDLAIPIDEESIIKNE
jgi:small subunit ribosomal protein S4